MNSTVLCIAETQVLRESRESKNVEAENFSTGFNPASVITPTPVV